MIGVVLMRIYKASLADELLLRMVFLQSCEAIASLKGDRFIPRTVLEQY